MTEAWHYTTALDLIDHWQTLIAGVLGFIAGALAFGAAITAVVFTLRTERRKLEHELKAVRSSLAVELRQSTAGALSASQLLRKLAISGETITARMVESSFYVPPPVIYLASADKIGLLGQDAMDVVIVYNLIDLARNGAERLLTSRTPNDISANTVGSTAVAFLNACIYATSVLPVLKTGVAKHDGQDVKITEMIETERAFWRKQNAATALGKLAEPPSSMVDSERRSAD
jgi:hypothetical protein